MPEHIDAAKFAPLLCAGLTVFNSIRHMNIGYGETVAIQGLGGLGHLAVQYANKFGLRVVAISRGADKEDFARQLGAHEYIDTDKGEPGAALEKLGGAALIMTTSPNGQEIPELLRGLGPLGKLLILSCKRITGFALEQHETELTASIIVPGDVTIDPGTMVG